MTTPKKDSEKPPGAYRDFQQQVEAKQRRKLHRQRQGEHKTWFGLGMFGLVGWSVAIPTLLAIALGIWLDRTVTGRYSWTLLLLAVGIALGCLNAWFWVSKEHEAINQQRLPKEDRHER
jgi:ATP synthase protein I